MKNTNRNTRLSFSILVLVCLLLAAGCGSSLQNSGEAAATPVAADRPSTGVPAVVEKTLRHERPNPPVVGRTRTDRAAPPLAPAPLPHDGGRGLGQRATP